jgi:two-component system, chemotaxis family, protein-glutamate methylesterase/glutaminase
MIFTRTNRQLPESAALAWGDGLVGIILTGAGSDGADGIRAIKKYGGVTIAHEPVGPSIQ